MAANVTASEWMYARKYNLSIPLIFERLIAFN